MSGIIGVTRRGSALDPPNSFGFRANGHRSRAVNPKGCAHGHVWRPSCATHDGGLQKQFKSNTRQAAFQLSTKSLSLDRRNVRQDLEPLVAAPLAIESATVAAYNAGSSAVAHFLGIPPYTENRRSGFAENVGVKARHPRLPNYLSEPTAYSQAVHRFGVSNAIMRIDDLPEIEFYQLEAPYPSSVWSPPLHGADMGDAPGPEPSKHKPAVRALLNVVCVILIGALVLFGLSHFTTRRSPTAVSVFSTTVRANVTTTVVSATSVPTKKQAPTTGSTAPGVLAGPAFDIHALIAKVSPSVVSIEISQRNVPVAAGSGVVVSLDGVIVTNAHVVDLTDQNGRTLSNASISIRLADGTLRLAKVLGSSAENDIAVIKVADSSGLVPAVIGNSDALEVGDDVVAIGNALDLGATPTVTKGIISAKDRTLQVDADLTLTGLLQTDAAINHGNSGGALVNASGQVIGINSAGIPNAQNLGFAIASKTFEPLISQLGSGQSPVAAPVAALGITTQMSADGVAVTSVSPGSGAETAGIQTGDIITAIDAKPTAAQSDVRAVIRAHQPGELVVVTIDRGGNPLTFTATLGTR